MQKVAGIAATPPVIWIVPYLDIKGHQSPFLRS